MSPVRQTKYSRGSVYCGFILSPIHFYYSLNDDSFVCLLFFFFLFLENLPELDVLKSERKAMRIAVNQAMKHYINQKM